MFLVKRVVVIMCAQNSKKIRLNWLKLFAEDCRLFFSGHGVVRDACSVVKCDDVRLPVNRTATDASPLCC